MKDVLKHKGFLGSVHFSAGDEIFFGKIEAIDDLVTFEGRSVEELKNAFHEAVDDYMELSQVNGKQKMRSFKGSFNVRIKPVVHRNAYLKALEEGLSLNQFVEKAITDKLQSADLNS